MAKTTASTYAIPSRIVAVEEKRRCREGCRKSLYGVRLPGAIFAVAHSRGRSRECAVEGRKFRGVCCREACAVWLKVGSSNKVNKPLQEE